MTNTIWTTGQHPVYCFLTTSPNAVVEPIDPKKPMPVILLAEEERDNAQVQRVRIYVAD